LIKNIYEKTLKKKVNNQQKILQMNKLIMTLLVILCIIAPTFQIEIPGIELSSDTVVGNILYESSIVMSMLALLVMIMVVA